MNPSLVMLASEVQATVSEFVDVAQVPSTERESFARDGACTDEPS